MGMNFKERKHGEVGEIIYPAYNGTNGFWQTPRWDLVTKVDTAGSIMDRRYIWDSSTVDAIEIMKKFFNVNMREQK